MSAERIWANSAAAGLLLLAALLIFTNLDDRRLWDDEAETALLAKSTLRFGVPLAWDGVTLISQECGTDYDSNYLWRQTPWLPIYVAAGSFALLDTSTFTARLPFALLGLLAVPSMYLLARRASGDRPTAMLAAGSLLLSVPFLLHVRQCRYYAVAILAAIWVLYFFFLLPTRRRLAAAGLALSLTVLLHASHLLFFGAVAGLALAALVLALQAAVLEWLAAAVAGTIIVNLPWLLGSGVEQTSGRLLALASVRSFVSNLASYGARIELYAFPAVLLAVALIALAVVTRARPDVRIGRASARASRWSRSRWATFWSSPPCRSSSSGTRSRSCPSSRFSRPGPSARWPREVVCSPPRSCSWRSCPTGPIWFMADSRSRSPGTSTRSRTTFPVRSMGSSAFSTPRRDLEIGSSSPTATSRYASIRDWKSAAVKAARASRAGRRPTG